MDPCLNNITFQLHVPTSGITSYPFWLTLATDPVEHKPSLPVKTIPSVSGLAILCRRHPDAKVNLHKVLAGICQSLVSFFKRNWSGGYYRHFSMTITNVSNGHCQMSPSFHSSLLISSIHLGSSQSFFLVKMDIFIFHILIPFWRWADDEWGLYGLFCDYCTIAIYAMTQNVVCGLHSGWASWFITTQPLNICMAR